MRKVVLAMFASMALVAAGSVAADAGQTGASAHHKRIASRHHVTHPSSDITSFSSSSTLHIGVNHPPKNR